MESNRFDKAIEALLKGYKEGTLTKGSCHSCAVGNMVAHCMGYHIIKDTDFGFIWNEVQWPSWDDVFCTSKGDQYFWMSCYEGEAKAEIDSTGYSPEELARVEYIFEVSTVVDAYNRNQYTEAFRNYDLLYGVFSVIKELCLIEGYDEEKMNETANLFTRCTE